MPMVPMAHDSESLQKVKRTPITPTTEHGCAFLLSLWGDVGDIATTLRVSPDSVHEGRSMMFIDTDRVRGGWRSVAV